MKIFRILLMSFLIVFPAIVQATQWAKTYGGRGAEQIPVFVQKTDGGLVAASSGPISTGKFDAWVISLSPEGDMLWQKRYERAADQEIFDIQRTQDGGYILTGVAATTNAGDLLLLKLDENGNIQWQKMYQSFNSDHGYSVTQTSDGGYVIAGTSAASPPVIDYRGFLIKTDSNGNIQWQKIYGHQPFGSGFRSIRETSDGGFIAAGEAGEADILVVKLDRDGNIIWQKGYDNYVESAGEIMPTRDGGYVLAGYASGRNLEDWAYVMKLDGNGNIQWQRFLETSFLSEGLGNVLETIDGYLISGSVRLSFNPYGTSDDDAWLVKLDKNGNLLWQKLYGAPPFTEFFSNIFTSLDGGLVAAGAAWTFGAGNYDVFVVKLDDNSDLPGCSLVRPASAVFTDVAFTVVTTNLTASSGVFTASDPGLVAIDTNYSPGNLCIDGTMHVPIGQHSYIYPTDITPSLNTDPQQAKPLALGHIAESYLAPLSLRIGVLPFSGPVDAYIGIYAPAISPEIWVLKPDNTLQPLSQGLVKWKGGVTERISESVVEFLDTTSLPSGDYRFFFGVTPTGSLSDFYLWETSFNKP